MSGNISRILGEVSIVVIETKNLHDWLSRKIISFTKFHDDIFKGLRFYRGRNSHFLLIWL